MFTDMFHNFKLQLDSVIDQRERGQFYTLAMLKYQTNNLIPKKSPISNCNKSFQPVTPLHCFALATRMLFNPKKQLFTPPFPLPPCVSLRNCNLNQCRIAQFQHFLSLLNPLAHNRYQFSFISCNLCIFLLLMCIAHHVSYSVNTISC